MAGKAAGDPQGSGPTIRFAGIGDEAAVSLPGQVGSLARLGWTSIELRTVDDTAVADLDDEAFARLVDTLRTQGLEVVCVASRIGNWSRPISGDFAEDLHELDVLERRCATLGTRYVRVMSYPNAGLAEREWGRRAVERLRRLAGRAEQAGLVLVHENCAGWAGTQPERMLALLEAVDSPALRLLFDTGNGVAHRYDAYDLLTQIVEHVAHVHIKDAEGSAPQPVYTLPGAGRARVADCLRLLLDRGYTGSWSIEPHLALQPHVAGARQPGNGAARVGVGHRDSFVASGQALERLVREQVLPTFPQWTTGVGGLVHRRTR
ncbi:MAG: sugar phosphate isomerase/epimerase [Actinomycetota bacterium]|nr:sugar phosphate isomerase/epimerase [Actinomycetota bacterium]